MTLQKQIDELLAQRASQWVDSLRQGDARNFAAFTAWVSESPRNLDEFLTIAALDRELESRDLYAQIDRDGLLRQIAPSRLAQMRRPQVSSQLQRRPLKRWKALALAAGVAVLGLSGFLARDLLTSSQKFATGIGELRSLELPDGSLVYLNAQSSVKLSFGDDSRDIELEQGEALFKVARDPRRAFQVRTRDAVVKALGTQFNVSARESGTRVAVLEGRVQVSSIGLAASPAAALEVGEAAQIPHEGRVQVTPQAQVGSAVAWRERRLVFVMAPLEEIVEEFNRFNRRRLRLDGVSPGERHYSGTFDADDPEALIAFLARERDLSVEPDTREIVIRERSRH